MNTVHHLAELFSKFPGIGARQARRFVFFLLQSEPEFVRELLASVESLKKEWGSCELCFRFFNQGEENKKTLCEICADRQTDTGTLMIVEKDIDLENIQKSGVYGGRYFVLGGLIPLLNGKQSPLPRFNALTTSIQKQIETGELKEVIFALSAHPEGEHTTLYLQKALEPIAQKKALKISVLGRGLSTGTELEYSDGETIKNALESRR